ncbi:MAG: DUF86 domain-containing protein [Deltaproteobacteria bacterium]|nr:DUF86 domain-containing protein [Deltaproteobacteria bacterium]MBN2671572.1 DUF86 domain-containing protein [Deltaproteobacteria bacterium]
MPHDPKVCIEGAVSACTLIIEFTSSMTEEEFNSDKKTQSAVERQFEVLGEALNRLKQIDANLFDKIEHATEIVGFRNVIAHGYDVVDNEIVWDAVQHDTPQLLKQLNSLL